MKSSVTGYSTRRLNLTYLFSIEAARYYTRGVMSRFFVPLHQAYIIEPKTEGAQLIAIGFTKLTASYQTILIKCWWDEVLCHGLCDAS